MKRVKVVFGDLEDMLSELKEKEIRDVRVAALYDERYSKEGIPFLKVYVTVQALLPQNFYSPDERVTAYLYAYYEKVTFKGIKPFTKEEMEPVFHENLRTKDEIGNRLTEAGFTLRAGYFREE